MSRTSMILGATSLAAVLVAVLVTRNSTDDTSASRRALGGETDRAASGERGDDAPSAGDTRHAARGGPERGEDDVTARWDEQPPAVRLEYLQKEFDTALRAIEAGDQPRSQHVSAAESALTAMRAELYDSERGRGLHREYETRLERALGEDTATTTPEGR